MKTVFPTAEVGADPYPTYEYLRTTSPVYKVPDRNEYVVTCHADVVEILDNPRTFSNAFSRHPEKQGRRADVLESDPPEHKHRRAFAFKALKPARIDAFLDRIFGTVDTIIDGFINEGRADIVALFSAPLPVHVLTMIFGLPFQDIWQILQESPPYTGGSARDFLGKDDLEPHKAGAMRQFDYLGEQIRLRASAPQDDLLTEMIEALPVVEGKRDLEYLQAEVDELFIGGMHTTGFLLTSAVRVLARRPDLADRLRADPAAISRLIEETMRLDSPVQWVTRMVTEDTTVHGAQVPAGSAVLLVIGAADRDRAVFDRADEFDLDRANVNDHLSWGHGIHYCLGARLARIEARMALERLLARLDDIRLSPGQTFEPSASPAHIAPRELHITFRGRAHG